MTYEGIDKQCHEPVVVQRNEHQVSRSQISHNALKVMYRLRNAGFEALLVGGAVRDLLLGRHPKDFDIATNALPEEIDELFRNCRLIGRRFRLAHIHFGKDIIEVATFRGPVTDHPEIHLEDGMIIRDNAYGNLEQDAWRRDFTINSLYYNIENFSLVDYVGGLADLEAGLIRPIGDPRIRFREDPVRMLRAVRFAAKLDFQIEQNSLDAIHEIGECLQGVPPARMFDEILKLFLSGNALAVYGHLRQLNLFQYLFPETQALLNGDGGEALEKIIQGSLKNTDERIQKELPVTPAFLLAVFLWGPVINRINYSAEQRGKQDNRHRHFEDVITRQSESIAIPRRFSNPMRDIWNLQFRLENKQGKRPLRLLNHPRFRAAYDFLALRVLGGEVPETLVDWWTKFQETNDEGRQKMLGSSGRKKRRRKKRSNNNGRAS